MKTLKETKQICMANNTCKTCPYYYDYGDGAYCYFVEYDTPSKWEFIEVKNEYNTILYSIQLEESNFSNDLFVSESLSDCRELAYTVGLKDYRIAKILVNRYGCVLDVLGYV